MYVLFEIVFAFEGHREGKIKNLVSYICPVLKMSTGSLAQ
jgi:hypothetical protein